MEETINRQKAEIERLQDLIEEAQQYNEAWVTDNGKLRKEAKNIKAEAVKEFAERLKATFPNREDPRCTNDDIYTLNIIDNLVKEFTEGG
jgi:regulator of replication initiation timing